MKSQQKTESDLLVQIADLPSVSVILPLENDFSRLQDLNSRLNSAKAQAKKYLTDLYPGDTAKLVLEKFDKLTEHIILPPDSNSLLIFVSPSVEKLLFLHSIVLPRVVIDSAFEIRDLAGEHMLKAENLVLLLSAEKAILYHREENRLSRIKFSVPWHIDAYKHDGPERVANFSDPDKRKEILLDKFLHHIDQGLEIALKSYALPLYLIAPQRVAGHFKKITKHLSSISSSIHGNYIDATPSELIEVLQANDKFTWESGKDIQKEIERAANEKKLARGMHEVQEAANNKNAKLLLIEQDAIFQPAQQPGRDAADEVIEKVISCGGDVRFVPRGSLETYGHIALIRYYRE